MAGNLLDYRLRQSQMVQFVLPNANMTYITHSYRAVFPLFTEEEYYAAKFMQIPNNQWLRKE